MRHVSGRELPMHPPDLEMEERKRTRDGECKLYMIDSDFRLLQSRCLSRVVATFRKTAVPWLLQTLQASPVSVELSAVS